MQFANPSLPPGREMTVIWAGKMPPSTFYRYFRCEGVGVARRVPYIKSRFRQGSIGNMWFGTPWTNPLAENGASGPFFTVKNGKWALRGKYLVNAWSYGVLHYYKVSYPWYGAFRGANRFPLSIAVTDLAPQPNRYVTGNVTFWAQRVGPSRGMLGNLL